MSLFRLDSVSIPKDSPLYQPGRQQPVGSFSGFDLIVIVGDNGSGKSQLTELLKGKSGAGLAVNGPAVLGSFDPKRHIEQSLLVRTTRELRESFFSLQKALEAAAGAERRSGEIKVLEALASPRAESGLESLRPRTAQLDAQIVDTERNNYRAYEDSLLRAGLGGMPWHLGTYNKVGADIADACGGVWTPVTSTDGPSMAASEAGLSAQGEPDLVLRIVTDMPDRMEMSIGTPWRLLGDEVQAAKVSLADSVAALRVRHPELAADDAESMQRELIVRIAQAEEEEKQISDSNESRSPLTNLLDRARSWMEGHAHAQGCPVCGTALEAAVLKSQIELRLKQEGDWSREQSERLTQLRSRLEAWREAQADMQKAMDGVAKAIDAVKEEVIWQESSPISRWIAELTEAKGRVGAGHILADKMIQCLEEAASVLGELGQDPWDDGRLVERRERLVAADAAIKLLIKDAAARVREGNASRQGLQAKRDQLAALRDLLISGERLNRLEWKPTWEGHASSERVGATIDRWKQAVEQLRQELESENDSAMQLLLANPALADRFRRLLANAAHPALHGVSLHPDRIERDGTEVSGERKTQLSEGYCVMTNLAAFFAVAGLDEPRQSHKAGWVVVDEPTTGLDAGNRDRVADYIGSLSMADLPRQIFVTTYDRSFANRLQEVATKHRSVCIVRLAPWSADGFQSPSMAHYPKTS